MENIPIDGSAAQGGLSAGSIEAKTMEIKPIDKPVVPTISSIEPETMETLSTEQRKPGNFGIRPITVRVVREELIRALGGQPSGDIKIGEIAPAAGITRRTVDRVCRYLERSGEFSFKRLHRGMRVTNLTA